MARDEAKFTEMLMYVAQLLGDDERGGATKLNKALWYAEVRCMRRYGHPITTAEYQKLPWGPAPRRLVPVREALIENGEARTVQDGDQERLIALRLPDLSLFEQEELRVIEDVVRWLRDMPAWKVSELSHGEPGWFLAEEGGTIIPEMAYLRPGVLLPEVRERARQLAAKYHH